MERTYENAIKVIESRQRRSRPTTASSDTLAAEGKPSLKGSPSIVGMAEWLRMLGYTLGDINSLNIIHVAGTKGKGSTCAFIESFLRTHGRRTGFPRKTGLYTSPHLNVPEERIRIDSMPLQSELFAKYLFELFDRLPQLKDEYDPAKPVVDRGPRALQLYALLAFHVFLQEEIDVAIIETHSGGEYDATNVVTEPVVTAITSLGMDHVDMLGPTIEDIAWHKSGIYKRGAVALSTLQESAPVKVLSGRAKDRDSKLQVVDIDFRLPTGAAQLRPTVQRKNASLAIAAAEAFLRQKSRLRDRNLTEDDIRVGVEQWVWPGRFQIIPDGPLTWFLDAAHNDMSVQVAARWFADNSAAFRGTVERVLIFSHINELRDAVALLTSLAKALERSAATIHHVVFTTYVNSKENHALSTLQNENLLHQTWKESFPDSQIWNEPTVERAMERTRALSAQSASTHVLVTGSQHLVGPALRLLQAN